MFFTDNMEKKKRIRYKIAPSPITNYRHPSKVCPRVYQTYQCNCRDEINGSILYICSTILNNSSFWLHHGKQQCASEPFLDARVTDIKHSTEEFSQPRYKPERCILYMAVYANSLRIAMLQSCCEFRTVWKRWAVVHYGPFPYYFLPSSRRLNETRPRVCTKALPSDQRNFLDY